MEGLPRYFVLESSLINKFLRYKQQQGAADGLVYLDGNEVISPFSKFELVPSKSEANEAFFHIRCCFRNKYLTNANASTVASLDTALFATADEAVEDRTLEKCTLFEPVFDQDANNNNSNKKSVRLRHVMSNTFVALDRRGYTLNVGPNLPRSSSTRFTIIDWESLVILPQTVVFKGDNGLYLGIHEQDDSRAYLKFDITDPASDRASHEVIYNRDGTVRIKSDYNGKFWRRSPNWIWADSTDTTSNDLDTVFRLVRGKGDDEVGLVNLKNNQFCSRLTTEGKSDCLNAHVSSMVKEATFTVEEPVMRRNIYDVVFHTKDATIYEETAVSTITKKVTNLEDGEVKTRVTHNFEVVRTTTWTHGDSFKCGVEATIKAVVPGIGEAGIKLSAEFETSLTWGTTKAERETIESSDEIPIPPKSIATISFVTTKGKCDIPFSYMRKDEFSNGKDPKIEKMHDGKFTCTNCYNFNIIVSKTSSITCL